MAAVTAEKLAKNYGGERPALANLSLSIPEGTVFGFLGPNGAGKTTTVKLMTGVLAPTGGACAVLGLDPAKEPEKVHALSGVMTETARSYGNLTGVENLRFFGGVCGLEPEAASRRAEELLCSLDLWEARDRALSAYSTGMAQRLSLARALVHRPRVLFLDEPTSGLDPEAIHQVNGLIASLAESEGTTVFLCTHQLRYAQDLCAFYGILERGELLAYGTLDEMRKRAGCRFRAELRLRDDDVLEGFHFSGGWHTREVRDGAEMPAILRCAVEAGHDVFEARLIEPSLEDVYFALTQEKGAAQ